MDRTISNFVVNNCEYTPIYLVQNPSGTQAEAIVITPCNNEVQTATTTNLKSFYENSGNFENGIIVQNVETRAPKSLLRKREVNMGNNLKLASFIVPSSDAIARPTVQVVNNKVAIKAPPIVTVPKSTNSIGPKINCNSKIVKIKASVLSNIHNRPLPKMKPKQQPLPPPPVVINSPVVNSVRAPSTYTSVQLLRLGETYHSLSNLDEHQMQIVNQALKNIKDPGTVPEPTYDPVTNTNIIYRVISAKDLAVVGNKNKLLIKSKKEFNKKEHLKKFQLEQTEDVDMDEPELCKETTYTRSGRQVKIPKLIMSEDVTQKKLNRRTGTTVSCTQCNMEFCSLYRLQRHYDMNPTHLPSKTHTDLFHCFRAIINGGHKNNRANIFVQQLEQLIDKLKSLLPCLLKKLDGSGQQCTVNEDIGRLFGMNAGKYNLNMDALSCIKDKDGYCKHNPKIVDSDLHIPTQVRVVKQNDDIVNSENETEDCARINSVEKLSTVTERIWKQRQKKKHKVSNKRIKLTEKIKKEPLQNQPMNSETSDIGQHNYNTNTNGVKMEKHLKLTDPIHQSLIELLNNDSTSVSEESTSSPHKFHSAHFDIRSSPIKSSGTIFRKFKISSPSSLSSNEVHILKPLSLDHEKSDTTNEQNITNIGTKVSNSHTENNISLSNEQTGQIILVPNHHIGQNIVDLSSSVCNTGQNILGMKPNICNEHPSQNILEINTNISNEHVSQNILDINPSISDEHSQDIFKINSNISGIHTRKVLEINHNVTDKHKNQSSSNFCNENAEQNILDINTNLTDEQEQSILELNANGHFDLPSLDDIDEQKDVDIVNDFPDVKNWVCNTEDTNSFLMSSYEGPIFVNTCKDQTMSSGIHENELIRTDSDLTLTNRTQSDFNFLETLGSDSLSYPEAEIRNNPDFHLDLFSFNTA